VLDPILALLDRDALGWLDEHRDALEVIRQARDEGRLRFVHTHILADELKPPAADVERLNALRQELKDGSVTTAPQSDRSAERVEGSHADLRSVCRLGT
jgi:hypothetical protein